MKVLIIYATNSGGTYVVSQLIKDTLSPKHEVAVKKTTEVLPAETGAFDLIILGSPSWNFGGKEGQPHETMLALLNSLKTQKFSGKKFALYGCGDSSYTHFCGAVDELEQFAEEVDGRLVLPSLKIDGFYFDLEKNVAAVKAWATKLEGKLTWL